MAYEACSIDKEATASIPPLAYEACSIDKKATTSIPPFAKGGLGGIRPITATNRKDKP